MVGAMGETDRIPAVSLLCLQEADTSKAISAERETGQAGGAQVLAVNWVGIASLTTSMTTFIGVLKIDEKSKKIGPEGPILRGDICY